MEALFVDGPAAGQLREYPYDTTALRMIEHLPIKADSPLSAPVARAVVYVKFATDHAGRSLFKLESQ